MAQQADERFIGRGPLQLAGLANYRYCAALGSCRCADIVEHPELVASDPVIGFSTARCIWTQLFGHDLGSHADGTEEGFRASSCYVKQGSAACRHAHRARAAVSDRGCLLPLRAVGREHA